MKDRQPTQVLANGAIRYGIYREDGTLDHYEYMKREDAPTIEGTPLNKANLLSDVTENKIWNNKEKPADPTVNDALYELSKGTARIGDISMTARGDRSVSWLPCDGRSISNVAYPDLYNVLRTDVDAVSWDEVEVTGLTGTHPSISYVNGHWFFVAKSGETAAKLKITTSDDLITFSTATVTITGAYFSTVVGCSQVHFYDGKYMFVYYLTNNAKHRFYIYYATSPTGPWKYAELWDGTTNGGITAATGGSGDWIPGDIYIYGGIYYVMHPLRSGSSSVTTTAVHRYLYAESFEKLVSGKALQSVIMDTSYYNSFVQDTGDAMIYAQKGSTLRKFAGLNASPIDLAATLVAPVCGFAVKSEKIVSVNGTSISYSLDGGDTLAGTTALGGTYDSNARNTAAYDGSILAFALTKNEQHYIAVTSALDVAPMIVETDYDITGFGINGSVVAGIVDTTEDQQIKILKRDFAYSAKRIPKITPDGRSYAYIKALEE